MNFITRSKEISKPIFIVGSGRSGTTILYNMLSTHPELAWFSNYSDKFLNFPGIAALHNILDLPFIGNYIDRNIINNRFSKFSVRPVEAENIYHSHCGFEKSRKTTKKDLKEETETKFKRLIRYHLSLTGKSRFVSKQTSNNQRLALIDSMFQDAMYLHIIRDGRAVTRSLLNVDWWDDVILWEREGRVRNLKTREDLNELQLAASHWKRNVQEILTQKVQFEDRYMEFRYEDLCANPRKIITSILDFTGLKKRDDFINMVPGELPNRNFKWKDEFSDSQKEKLDNHIGDYLSKLGYDV